MVGIMQFLHIVLPTLMLVSTAGSATGIQYVVFGLNSARSNSSFPVSILVLNATSEVRIDMALIGRPPATSYGLYSNYDSGEMLLYASASLKGDDRFLVFNASAVIQANKLAHLEIDVGDLSSMVKEPMVFVLNGSDSSDSFRTGFSQIKIENSETTTVTKQAKTKRRPVVFIQTDQPLYKANDTVRFRVVSVESVDGQLRPVFVPFTVQILDPQRDIVQLSSNANDTQVVGYFSAEMPLPSNPLLGSWTVRVVRTNKTIKASCLGYTPPSPYGGSYESSGGNGYDDDDRKKRKSNDDETLCNPVEYRDTVLASKDFSVEELVVPRSDVRIITSKSYIVPRMEEDFRFQVVANYAFGAPTKGTFDVGILRSHREEGHARYDAFDPVWNHTISTDNSGTASISVPAQFLSNLTDESKITIRVNFTETVTGQKWNATPATVSVKTKAYNIQFQDDAKTFIPGYPYTLKATITDWDGRPPSPSTKKAITALMGFFYFEGHAKRISSSGTVRCRGKIYPPPNWGNYDSSYRGGDYGFETNGGGFGGGGYGGNKRSTGFGIHEPVNSSSSSSNVSDCHPFPDLTFVELDVDGTIGASLPTPKNATAAAVVVYYQGTSETLILFGKQSPSGSFLEISQVTSNLQVDKVAEFAVNTTTRTDQTIHIVVLSTSNASFLWSDSISRSGQFVNISVPITAAMGPSGRLIAYYVASDGELVGNIKAFSVLNDTAENVTLLVQAKSDLFYAEPAAEITIRAHSSPSAFIAFLAMDESLLLQKSGNDITQNVLDTKPKPQQKMQPSYMQSVEDYFTKAIDSGRVQQFLLTNTMLSTTSIPRAQDYYSSNFGNNQGPGFGSGGGSYDSYAGYSSASYGSGYGSASPFDSGLEQSAQTRKDFRQSFLFETAWAEEVGHLNVARFNNYCDAVMDIVFGSANGDVKLERKVPDAITTWRISAFSLSNTSGLRVTSEPVKLKVFRPS